MKKKSNKKIIDYYYSILNEIEIDINRYKNLGLNPEDINYLPRPIFISNYSKKKITIVKFLSKILYYIWLSGGSIFFFMLQAVIIFFKKFFNSDIYCQSNCYLIAFSNRAVDVIKPLVKNEYCIVTFPWEKLNDENQINIIQLLSYIL